MPSVAKDYFERMYAADDDPWEFGSSWYELRKYRITLAALPERRYRRAVEPGCSIGVLTAMLAAHCDELLASDFMAAPVLAAAQRVRGLHRVQVERRTMPEEWPSGPFDLVVLSELAYYFDADGLRTLLARACASAEPGATLVAVHWRGPTDYPLTGDEAHEVIGATPGLRPLVHHLEDAFVLDVWRYAP